MLVNLPFELNLEFREVACKIKEFTFFGLWFTEKEALFLSEEIEIKFLKKLTLKTLCLVNITIVSRQGS